MRTAAISPARRDVCVSKRLIPLFVCCFLMTVAGCGGASSPNSNTTTSTPQVDSSRDSLLNGSYVFAIADKGCACRFAAAGSLQADGAGHISAGLIDVNSDDSVQTAVPITGTYNIGQDGRGTASLAAGTASYQFRFAVVSNQRALIMGFDTHQNASGTIDLASPVTSLAPNSYVFHVSGMDGFGEAIEMAGTFVLDAKGNVTSGVADLHDNQDIEANIPLQAGSALNLSFSSGRTTGQVVTPLVTLGFALYAIDSHHYKLVSKNKNLCPTSGCSPAPVLIGDLYQSSASTITGAYAFTLYGWSEGQPLPFAAGGVFNVDGTGSVSGAEDINNNGSVNKALPLTGSVTIASTGRGTATLAGPAATSTFAVYPWATGVEIIEIDSNAVAGGSAFPQQDAPYSAASLKGNFAYGATGSSGNNSDALAAFSADGNGSLSGTMDLNTVGSPQSGLALTGTYSLTGQSGAAKFQTAVNTQNVGLYPVIHSRVLTLSLDSSVIMTGEFEQQQ